MSTIGERIRVLREQAGKNQSAIYDCLGMSRPTYIAIEKSRRPPTPNEIITIASAIGCQVSDIVGDPVKRLSGKRPLQAASELFALVQQVDDGDISECVFRKAVGLDIVSARGLMRQCEAVAGVLVAALGGRDSSRRNGSANDRT